MKRTVTDFLEESAERFGSKRAVVMNDQACTYSQLKDEAQRMGTFLAKHLGAGSPVPIYMEKCTDMVACFFGVAYAGCFYSPISKEQAEERVKKILTTLEAQVVVTDDEGAQTLADMGYTGTIFRISDMKAQPADPALLAERRRAADPGLLYVMFTSGSTGTPKGVAVSQQSVIDFIGHFVQVTGITSEDRIGNQAPFDFDVSVKDIYSAVATGAELVLIEKVLFAQPAHLLDYLDDKQVTTLIWAVPALTLISVMNGFDYKIPRSLNKIMFSGAAMPIKQLRKWMAAIPDAQYINLYGPTEVTCNCTYYKLPHQLDEGFKLPIGPAFPGRHVFLVDKAGKIVDAVGATGEICAAGQSLAEGYYHNPQATAKSFVTINGERVYKTGDLATVGQDGQYYFAGRADFQVKIMGHRIELEEIENALLTVPGVEQCCCVYLPEKGRITGFITGGTDGRTVKQAMRKKMPAYMIPTHIRELEALPLNLNGKIDRKALQAMAH
jgi:D-alanine--poly(phosphoribitol) ligase subunit 1